MFVDAYISSYKINFKNKLLIKPAGYSQIKYILFLL